MDRSNLPEVRNPILGLPAAMAAIGQLDKDQREGLRAVLLAIQGEARNKEAESIRKRKGPMIAYWMAAGVYCGHIARALRKVN